MVMCHHCGQSNLDPVQLVRESKNAFGNAYSFIQLFCRFCNGWIGDKPPVDKPQAA